MAGCNELIGGKSHNFGSMPIAFEALFRRSRRDRRSFDEKFEMFIADLGAYNDGTLPDMARRYVMEEHDPELDVKGLADELYGIIDGIALGKQRQGVDFDYNYVMGRVMDTLRLNDLTAEADGEPTPHPESDDYVIRQVAADVAGHVAEALGDNSSETVGHIMADAKSRFVRLCLWDDVAGESTDGDVELNEALWRERARMYRDLVRYLKVRFGDDRMVRGLPDEVFYIDSVDGETGVRSRKRVPPETLTLAEMDAEGAGYDLKSVLLAGEAFRRLVVEDEGFRDKFVSASYMQKRLDRRNALARSYSEVAEWLVRNGGDKWRETLDDWGVDTDGDGLRRLVTTAYEGNARSYYANVVADYLKTLEGMEGGARIREELDIDPVSVVRNLETGLDDPLVSAFGDYMGLLHFNELLEASLGKVISIDGDLRLSNVYNRNSMVYHRNLSGDGLRRGYSKDDQYDAAEATTEEMKAIVGNIGLYTYDGAKDEYNNSTLTPISLGYSFTKLLRGILDGRIRFDLSPHRDDDGSTTSAGQLMNMIRYGSGKGSKYGITGLDKYDSDPNYNMRWFFRQLFGRPDDALCGNPDKDGNYERTPLIRRLEYRRGLRSEDKISQQDVNVLYSFYRAVLDPERPNSMVSAMRRNGGVGMPGVRRAYDVVTRYLSSNSIERYVDTVTGFDGEVTLSVLNGVLSQYDVAPKREAINMHANGSGLDRADLAKRYGFNHKEKDHGNMHWTVTLGDGTGLDIVTDGQFGIMYGDEQSSLTVHMTPEDRAGWDADELWSGADDVNNYWSTRDDARRMAGYWKALDDASILGLQEMMRSDSFDPQRLGRNERALYETLRFVDDFLGLGILARPDIMLGVLAQYKALYSPAENVIGQKNYMMPLVKMAMRGAYANEMYLEAAETGMTLRRWLIESGEGPFKAYRGTVNQETKKLLRIGFSPRGTDVSFNVASMNDHALAQWVDANRQWNNQQQGAVIYKSGRTLPSMSIAKLATKLYETAGKVAGEKGAAHLQYVARAVDDIEHVGDFSAYGDSKTYGELNQAELLFNGPVNWLYNDWAQHKAITLVTSPYGEKSTTAAYRISLDELKGGNYNERLNLDTAKREDIYGLYAKSVGLYYRDAYARATDSLRSCLGDVAERGGVPAGVGARIKELIGGGGDGVYEALAMVDESALLDAAQRLGRRLTRDLEYRVNPDGILVGNELLRSYARLADTEAVRAEFDTAARSYVRTLLRHNVRFSVLDPGDRLEFHTGEARRGIKDKESANAVYRAVGQFLGSSKFYEPSERGETLGPEARVRRFYRDWVSQDGTLILAKLDGRDIRDPLDWDGNGGAGLELNPFLEFYMLVDSTLSEGLNVFLAGSEAGNAVKGSGRVIRDTGAMSAAEVADRYGVDVGAAAEALGILNARIKDGRGRDTEMRVINGVHDLMVRLDALRAERPADDQALVVLDSVLARELENSVSEAVGTNDKRGGMVVSPGQTAMRGTLEGVPEEIGVVCFENIMGKAWNYTGAERDVDAGEGMSLVTYFQNADENFSFGDHASGKLMKTMLYNFYSEFGTMDYIKHASNTITNASMQRTENGAETSITHRGVFRKLTNSQWGGDVVLTRNGLDGWSDERHVRERIFGNEDLYYRGANGERRRIETLGRDLWEGRRKATGPQYYTLEGDGMWPDDAPVRVYHLFYNLLDGEGNVVEESVHKTFRADMYDGEDALRNAVDSAYLELEKAGARPHTINSIYELHSALGGMWCVDADGNQSEANNDVICRFRNFTVTERGGGTPPGRGIPERYTQRHFIQPLKRAKYHRGYAVPVSTMKRGAANINSLESMYARSTGTPRWFTIGPEGLMIQQEGSKKFDEAEGIVGSQMMNSLSANGTNPEKVDELNRAIGRRMAKSTERLRKAVEALAASVSDPAEREEAVGRLYGIAGGLFIDRVTRRSYDNIADDLTAAVRREFASGGSHLDDAVYLPVSNPAVYKDFMGTLSSFITEEVIRIRMKGLGMVLAPSKNMVRIYDTYVGGRRERLLPQDVLKRAEAEYRGEMLKWLRSRGEHDAATDTMVYEGAPQVQLEAAGNAVLERMCLALSGGELFSDYYTAETDTYRSDAHRSSVWLRRRADEAYRDKVGVYDNREWFTPGDVVDVLDDSGNVVETVELDLDNYASFKEGFMKARPGADGGRRRRYGEGMRYRINMTEARDLKPGTMRWRWKDASGAVHWANWFDLPHVRRAMKDMRLAYEDSYYDTCNEAMKRLGREGKFRLNANGPEIDVYGEIERTNPETVHGNIYGRTFGIREGDTLADVMERGEGYFEGEMGFRLRAPASNDYDLAFIDGGGRHSYIRFGDFTPSELTVERPWDGEYVRDDGEIWVADGMNDRFRVGRWVDAADSDLFVQGRRVRSYSGRPVDARRYRVLASSDGTSRIQRRIDLVRRYDTVLKRWTPKGLRDLSATLYNVAYDSAFKEAYGVSKAEDVKALRNETVAMLYGADDHLLAEMPLRRGMSEWAAQAVADSLDHLAKNVVTDRGAAGLMLYQRDMVEERRLQSEGRWNGPVKGWKEFMDMKREWYRTLTREKWVGFQDSLKLVSCRIPTAGLQSFMDMETVGWTGDNTNTAYVSHFQIFLQGSDYDIDKANVTGQEYDSTGRYIGWSPFFETGSLRLLERSKRLPTPSGVEPDGKGYRGESERRSVYGADITDALFKIFNKSTVDFSTGRLTADGKTEDEKLEFLDGLREALYAIAATDGKYKWDESRLKVRPYRALQETLRAHEMYEIPQAREDLAYKNSIMSRIYEVSGDVANMVPSNMETSTAKFSAAADSSAINGEEMAVSRHDPGRKFVAAWGARSSKRGVGINANGDKMWNNWYQYVTRALTAGSEERRANTLFDVTIDGVAGRADGGFARARKVRVRHIPDLNTDNKRLDAAMRGLIAGYRPETERFANVKNNLMEFINVATDDPKLHILQRINGIPDMLSDYNALMMLGFSPKDAVAFMTSPYISEVINVYDGNMFERGESRGKVDQGVEVAAGRVSSGSILHGMAKAGNDEYSGTSKISDVRNKIAERLANPIWEKLRTNIWTRLVADGKASPDGLLKDVKLDDVAQAFVQAAASMPGHTVNGMAAEVTLLSDVYGTSSDAEVTRYVREVDRRVKAVRDVALKYVGDHAGSEADRLAEGVRRLLADRDTYRTLRGISNELTRAATSYLSFNQGVTYGDLEYIRRVDNMNRIITDREKELGISPDGLAKRDADGSWKYDSGKLDAIVGAIRKNVGDRPVTIDVVRVVKEAYERGIMGSFDVRRFFTENPYRRWSIRYLELIKAVVNTLDMMDALPHYREMLRLFSVYDLTMESLSVRKRLMMSLANGRTGLDERALKDLSNVADTILSLDYLKDKTFTLPDGEEDGFDENWDIVRTDSYALGTEWGQGGFCRYVTGPFLKQLKALYGDNAFVDRLQLDGKDGRIVLDADIDMLNPNRSEITRWRFGDMKAGLSVLKDKPFWGNPDYSVADVIYLYNLVENGNRVERKSLTSALVALGLEDGVAGDYNRFLSGLDRTQGYVPEYSTDDVDIMLAPKVESGAERWHRERYVKVLDDSGGWRLMRRSDGFNGYFPRSFNETVDRTADPELREARMNNYLLNAPVQMPNWARGSALRTLVEADGGGDRLATLLANSSISGMSHFAVGAGDRLKMIVTVPKGSDLSQYGAGLLGPGGSGWSKIVVDVAELPKGHGRVDYGLVAETVRRLDPEWRSVLTDLISDSNRFTLTDKDIENLDVIGNVSCLDLYNIHRIPRDYIPLSEAGMKEEYNILYCRGMEIGGDRWSGRFVNGDGSMTYIVDGEESAKRFLRYRQARETVALMRSDGRLGSGKRLVANGLPEGDLPALDAVRLARSSQLGLKDAMGYADLFSDFLESAESYGEVEVGGRMVSSMKVMNDAFARLTSHYYINELMRLTDKEAEMWRMVADKRDASVWEFGREELFSLLRDVPGFDTAKEEFMAMGSDALQELLLDPETGLFVTSDLFDALAVASVVEATLPGVTRTGGKTEWEATSTVTDWLRSNWKDLMNRLPEDMAPKDVAALHTGRGKKRRPVSFEEFKGKSLRDKNRLLKAMGVMRPFVGADGTESAGSYQVEAVERGNGRSFVVRANVLKQVDEKYGRSTVKFKVGRRRIGDDFNFGWRDKFPLKPVNGLSAGSRGVITDGKYKGMYIYVTQRDGRTQFVTMRDILNPDERGYNKYWNIEDAVRGIEAANANDTLDSRALFTLKQTKGYVSRVDLEARNIYEGQYLTVLNRPVPGFDYKWMFGAFRNLLKYTGRQFHRAFDAECGTEALVTPEMCAAYLAEQYRDLYVGASARRKPTGVAGVIDDIIENHRSDSAKWDGVVRSIAESDVETYRIDDMWYNTRTKTQTATIRHLRDNGVKIDVSGEPEGRSAYDIVNGTFVSAMRHIGEAYGATVRLMTSSEMKDDEALDGLGIKEKLNTVRAFVHDGVIYINTTNAREGDLYHELVHIMMGIVKEDSYDDYDALIDKYRNDKDLRGPDGRVIDFKAEVGNVRRQYKGIAYADAEEEAVARIIARQLYRSLDLRIVEDVRTDEAGNTVRRLLSGTGFNVEVFGKAFERILTTLKAQMARDAEAGAEWSDMSSLGAWLTYRNGRADVRNGRALTNMIRQMLLDPSKDKELREICK